MNWPEAFAHVISAALICGTALVGAFVFGAGAFFIGFMIMCRAWEK